MQQEKEQRLQWMRHAHPIAADLQKKSGLSDDEWARAVLAATILAVCRMAKLDIIPQEDRDFFLRVVDNLTEIALATLPVPTHVDPSTPISTPLDPGEAAAPEVPN